MKLIGFELSKIWRTKSFLLLMLFLAAVNFFFLWYLHLPGDTEPPLSAYRALQEDLRGKTETEKREFLLKLHKDMENYGEAFQTGAYLRYTDTFDQEQALIEEAYAEMMKVSGYRDFLTSVGEQRDMLASVSVFHSGGQDFSSRNVEQEMADYMSMEQVQPSIVLSKGVRSAMELPVTDLLLYLSVFFFAGGSIYEERNRRLFLVIRAAPRGRAATIGAKLAALALHCCAVTACFYGSSLTWCFAAAGMPNLGAPLQSLAPYMESTLSLSIGGFLLLSLALKAAILFAFGALLLTVAVGCRQHFMTAAAGAAVMTVSAALYVLIPANSSANWMKYLNFIGAMRTESVLGGYLNFNLLGHPVSRLLALAMLIGYQHLSQSYTLTPSEHYYQNMMVELEGTLTAEKKTLIKEEQERYDAAFAELDRIEKLQSDGKVDERTASAMAEPYYKETAFYPAFQRILTQYSWVKGEKSRTFVYDTGYLMMLGLGKDDGLQDYLLLTACMILAFSGVFAMEHQNGTWKLLAATARGENHVRGAKVKISLAACAAVCLTAWGSRLIQTAGSFPLHQLWSAAENLSVYRELGLRLPLALFLTAAALVQILVMMALSMAVLYLSDRLKSQIAAMCLGGLFLAVPPVLCAMGLTFTRWWSLLPLYQFGKLLAEAPAGAVCSLAGCAAVFAILWRKVSFCPVYR